MARRTKEERIAILEARRDQLEEMQERNESVSLIKAQGASGASTEFLDPRKIVEMLNDVEMKLGLEYMAL